MKDQKSRRKEYKNAGYQQINIWLTPSASKALLTLRRIFPEKNASDIVRDALKSAAEHC